MSTVARQPEPITREGYARLRAELDYLATVRRRQLEDDLRQALERRIDELDAALSFARIVDPPADGVAGIGHRVRLRLAADASPVEYELVGPLESDPAQRRISIDSPVGRAVAGHRPGDVVQVQTPGGARSIELLAVGDALHGRRPG